MPRPADDARPARPDRGKRPPPNDAARATGVTGSGRGSGGGDSTGSSRPTSGRPGQGDGARAEREARDRARGGERTYDPRREARRQLSRVPLPDDVESHELDRDVRKELISLSKETADLVARHLVMAGRLMDEQPAAALAHARAARALAGRVGAVREANGLVAYAAGEWAEALSELRTARRLTGEADHLPVMADCERALDRPDRALLMAEDPQAASLDPAAKVELLIVSSGARRDLGQPAAAVVSLQVGALEGPVRGWTARLRYAYADALLDAGRTDDARQWFARAAEVDEHGSTDAEDRLLELDGMVFADHQSDLPESDREDHAKGTPTGGSRQPPQSLSAADLADLVAGMVALGMVTPGIMTPDVVAPGSGETIAEYVRPVVGPGFLPPEDRSLRD